MHAGMCRQALSDKPLVNAFDVVGVNKIQAAAVLHGRAEIDGHHRILVTGLDLVHDDGKCSVCPVGFLPEADLDAPEVIDFSFHLEILLRLLCPPELPDSLGKRFGRYRRKERFGNDEGVAEAAPE